MTGRIIPLHGDLHDEVSMLLPWYVTGRLDDDEKARVDLHLKTCAQCQVDLAAERHLQAEVADLPEDKAGHVDNGWAALREQMGSAPQRPGQLSRLDQQWRASAPWLRWAVAAQFSLLFIGAGVFGWQATRPAQPQPQYHALGAKPVAVAGNIVVVFRPEVSERDLRQALRDNHARMVDGPTAADAYLLSVPAGDRDAAVTRLRGDRAIVLAEPVDAGDAP